jgi:hypothetical protein
MSQLPKLFAKALARAGNEHTFADIEAEARAGRMQLWPGGQSLAVTEIRNIPGRKALHILYAAGNGPELEEMTEAMAAWAKVQGCTSLTGTGRPGWAKRMKQRGWRTIETTLERPLS